MGVNRFIVAAATACLALAGCESFITIDATIEVPVEVQELYSADAPGAVKFGFDVPKTNNEVYELGVLCEPTADSLALAVLHDSFGCAKEGTAFAWIEPAPAGATCGLIEPDRDFLTDLPVPDDVPRATTVLFAGETSRNGCGSGEETIQLRIE